MADYDIYKTVVGIFAQTSDFYGFSRTTNVNIIEWNHDNIDGFNIDNIINPTSSLFGEKDEFLKIALIDNEELDDSLNCLAILHKNISGYNVSIQTWVNGRATYNINTWSEIFTIVYNPISKHTYIIGKKDGNYIIFKPTYTLGSTDYIGELYNFKGYVYRELSNLTLLPISKYISKGGTIQFNLTAEYDDGSTEDVTNSSIWWVFQYVEDDVVQSLDGYTITNTGLLTAVDPTYPYISIGAEYNNIKTFAAAYLTDFPGMYNPGGVISGSIGGKGEFGKNEVSDVIDVPSGSVAGDASSTGMFTRYLANSSYLDTFGEWLWTTDFGLHVARTVISLIYGNPADSVISVMSYPFDIKTLSGVTTKQQNLVWGNFDSGLSFNALTSGSATIDWGTISLKEYWGNFLDYEPHTKIELYLPWGTGFVSIDPGQCLPGTLQVITNIDLSKGSCIHSVIGNNGCVIGTYAGQCSQQIPILSNDYASKVAGVVVGATALAVAGTAGGGAVSAGNQAAIDYGATHSMPFGDASGMAQYRSGLESAIASSESPYLSTQRTAGKLAAASSLAALRRSGIVARNGSFTDGSAALGVQYPYIILSRPTQSVPEEYGHHYGYPSNIYVKLGNIRGYTEVGEIHLDGISATESEIAELDSILKGGVIF